MSEKPKTSVKIYPETFEVLEEIKDMIEQDIYDKLPHYAKYEPEITFKQILQSILTEYRDALKESII